MVNHKPVKIIINTFRLAKVIIDKVVRQNGLLNLIVTNKNLFFRPKFLLLLCYLFGIKRWLFNAFHLQIDGQIKRQNSTIKVYLQAFINFDQNNLAKFLPMAEFVYNNIKIAITGHTVFELNCGYHSRVFFNKDTNLRS